MIALLQPYCRQSGSYTQTDVENVVGGKDILVKAAWVLDRERLLGPLPSRIQAGPPPDFEQSFRAGPQERYNQGPSDGTGPGSGPAYGAAGQGFAGPWPGEEQPTTESGSGFGPGATFGPGADKDFDQATQGPQATSGPHQEGGADTATPPGDQTTDADQTGPTASGGDFEQDKVVCPNCLRVVPKAAFCLGCGNPLPSRVL